MRRSGTRLETDLLKDIRLHCKEEGVEARLRLGPKVGADQMVGETPHKDHTEDDRNTLPDIARIALNKVIREYRKQSETPDVMEIHHREEGQNGKKKAERENFHHLNGHDGSPLSLCGRDAVFLPLSMLAREAVIQEHPVHIPKRTVMGRKMI